MTACKHHLIDQIGNGLGIGDCQKIVDYKASGATKEQIEEVRRKYLGSKLFSAPLCDETRNCLRYEPIETKE